MSIWWLIPVVYLFIASMWSQYLAVMNMKRNHKKLTLTAKLWAYPIAAAALISDVLFNFIFGTVAFIELPQEWLFTYRCSRHLNDSGWRGKIARWFCRNFMDPFDPDGRHCGQFYG